MFSLKKIEVNNDKIKKIKKVFLFIKSFVLSIKIIIMENIIKDLIKLDLSPVIKILNGTKNKNTLKKIFSLKPKFLFRKYAAIRKPKHKISPPTTSSSLKKLTILVASGLMLPKTLWPKTFSNNTSSIIMLIITSQFFMILSKIFLSSINCWKAYIKKMNFIKLNDLIKPS